MSQLTLGRTDIGGLERLPVTATGREHAERWPCHSTCQTGVTCQGVTFTTSC